MSQPEPPLVELLRQAVAALDAAAVPDDLRAVAFGKAVDFLAGGTDEPRSASVSRPSRPGKTEPAPTASDEPIGKIAARVNLDPELVSRVYDVDDEGVHLTVPRSSLNEKKRLAMQEVARLIMAGRQALGLDEFTPSKVVREACEGRGVLDQANFAAAFSALDGHGMRLRGTGASREAKLNAAGFEAAAEDIKRIVGAS